MAKYKKHAFLQFFTANNYLAAIVFKELCTVYGLKVISKNQWVNIPDSNHRFS